MNVAKMPHFQSLERERERERERARRKGTSVTF